MKLTIVLSYSNSLFVKVKSFEMLNSQKINDCVGWGWGGGYYCCDGLCSSLA